MDEKQRRMSIATIPAGPCLPGSSYRETGSFLRRQESVFEPLDFGNLYLFRLSLNVVVREISCLGFRISLVPACFEFLMVQGEFAKIIGNLKENCVF